MSENQMIEMLKREWRTAIKEREALNRKIRYIEMNLKAEREKGTESEGVSE